jgi:hypothetical protein
MSIRIEGKFLGSTAEVWFDNVSAIYLDTEEWIEVRVPKMPNASVNITVIDDVGNENTAPFAYQNPVIISQHPTRGPKNGVLHLYGTYLINTSVWFEETPGQILTQTDEEVTVLVPDLYGESRVILRDPYENETSASFFFENPHLNLLDPESGPIGKPLNLYGEYLGNTSMIRFEGRDASFERVSEQWIRPIVPEGSGTASIEWFDFFGNSLLYPNRFTYENPIIDRLSETHAPQRSILTLYGNFLFEIVRIQFGDADADILLIENATSIRIKVPDQAGDPIVPVLLTDRYGNLARYQYFTYTNPQVTDLSPEQGPARTLVTFYGSYLSYTDTVTFDQSNAEILERKEGSIDRKSVV